MRGDAWGTAPYPAKGYCPWIPYCGTNTCAAGTDRNAVNETRREKANKTDGIRRRHVGGKSYGTHPHDGFR